MIDEYSEAKIQLLQEDLSRWWYGTCLLDLNHEKDETGKTKGKLIIYFTSMELSNSLVKALLTIVNTKDLVMYRRYYKFKHQTRYVKMRLLHVLRIKCVDHIDI